MRQSGIPHFIFPTLSLSPSSRSKLFSRSFLPPFIFTGENPERKGSNFSQRSRARNPDSHDDGVPRPSHPFQHSLCQLRLWLHEPVRNIRKVPSNICPTANATVPVLIRRVTFFRCHPKSKPPSEEKVATSAIGVRSSVRSVRTAGKTRPQERPSSSASFGLHFLHRSATRSSLGPWLD